MRSLGGCAVLAVHRDRDWVTMRAAFGPKGAAKALALQLRVDASESAAFRLISNLTPDHAWQVEGTFSRSDAGYEAYLARCAAARLFDYFDQQPKRTPPRWLIPSRNGVLLTRGADSPTITKRPETPLPARRGGTFLQRILRRRSI